MILLNVLRMERGTLNFYMRVLLLTICFVLCEDFCVVKMLPFTREDNANQSRVFRKEGCLQEEDGGCRTGL